MTVRRHLPGPAAIGLALAPTAARAHAPFAGAGDFYAGLLSPLTALAYLVPLFAFGLLVGQQPGERGYRAAFLLAAVGAAAAWLAPPLPAAWFGHATAATTAIVGAAVAAAWSPPAFLLHGLTAALGLGLGCLHALEWAPGIGLMPFTLGFAVAALLVPIYCCGIVRALRPAWARLGVRIAGSWLAAIGGLILGLAFRP